MSTMHATAVSREGRGVLLLGGSGAGKSALAMELMAYGGSLLADDAVEMRRQGAEITMHCPVSIKGKIEARGVGLLLVNSVDQAKLAFVVDLDKISATRLPAPETLEILGVEFPMIRGKNMPGLGAVIWCLLGGGQLLPIE